MLQGTRHLFGLTSSPHVAIETLRRHARAHGDQYPWALQAVLRHTMVDDILVAGDDWRELKKLRTELEELLALADMKAHKFSSNYAPILEGVATEDIAKTLMLCEESATDLDDDSGHPLPKKMTRKSPRGETPLTVNSENTAYHRAIANFDWEDACPELHEPSAASAGDQDDLPIVKTLGIMYYPETDVLTFRPSLPVLKNGWTLRKLASVAAQIFDPRGLISPVTITGRRLVQTAWLINKVQWDDVLPLELQSHIHHWIKEANKLYRFSIPRTLVPSGAKPKRQELCVFTDASGKAQAAVAYMRTEMEDGSYHVSLVASKSKVSPLKKTESIPRLEAQAALMGTHLARAVCKALGFDMSTVRYFSDSQTVLWWLKSDRPLETYVGNRVCAILDHSTVKQWFYVNTKLNPADLPSRGVSVKQIEQGSIWKEGAPFLWKPDTEWPEQPVCVRTREAAVEERKVISLLHFRYTEKPWLRPSLSRWLRELLGRYSSFGKGLRVAACAFLFVLAVREQAMKNMTLEPIQRYLLNHLIVEEQQKHFSTWMESKGAHTGELHLHCAEVQGSKGSHGLFRIASFPR